MVGNCKSENSMFKIMETETLTPVAPLEEVPVAAPVEEVAKAVEVV